MIRNFRHKGLAELFERGCTRHVRADLVDRAMRRLDALHAATVPGHLRMPGFDFHPLRGNPPRFSVHVNGPWCITFGWLGSNAIDVDLEQYH